MLETFVVKVEKNLDNILISFSGGRSSAMMLKLLIDQYGVGFSGHREERCFE